MKTLIIAQLFETNDYKHYAGYVLDQDGKQHLIDCLNHKGNTMESGKPYSTFRASHWGDSRRDAKRAFIGQAVKDGHGSQYLLVWVSGNNEESEIVGGNNQ